MDEAGNEKSVTATVTIDTVPPTVSAAVTNSPFSDKTGHASATLTIKASDDAAGIKSITYTINNGSAVTATSGTAITINSSTTGITYGTNTIVATAIDNAGNSKTANATVVYDNKVDSLSIGTLQSWYTAQFSPSVTFKDDYAGLAHLYVWADNTSGSAKPATCADVLGSAAKSGATISVPSASVSWGQSASADCYLHVLAIDAVGNELAVEDTFGYETTAPAIASANFKETVYNSTTAQIVVSGITKSTSDITNITVSGAGVDPDPTTLTYNAAVNTYSVTLSTGDGMKTVTVTVTDAAGLTSTATAATSTELDTTDPSGTIDLQNASGGSIKGKKYNSDNPKIVLRGYDDGTSGYAVKYELYGDFSATRASTSGTEATNPIKGDLTAGAATITNLYAVKLSAAEATSCGTRNYYVVYIDNAGNRSTPITCAYIYDTSEPEVTISTQPDYQQISKETTARRSSPTTTIEGTSCDTMHFSFKEASNDYYQAYKVVAYKTKADANAGTYADAAIPTTGGSSNTSTTGKDQNTAIDVTITGADFEAALGGAGNDGIHYVVIYIQDLAGNWSKSAVIPA